MSFYESDRALAEYLLFHYGTPEEILPFPSGPADALGFPVRCVTECVRWSDLAGRSRALDLGCATGRSTFELARQFKEVTGVDLSRQFIAAARELAQSGTIIYRVTTEGRLMRTLEAVVPPDIDRARVRFETGDVLNLPGDLGSFDFVLAANLIDRLPRPAAFLKKLGRLVRSGGQLVLTSPYTWLEDYTPENEWLGGRQAEGEEVRSSDSMQKLLAPDFTLLASKNVPFLIREHERKYQWSVAEATTWRRR